MSSRYREGIDSEVLYSTAVVESELVEVVTGENVDSLVKFGLKLLKDEAGEYHNILIILNILITHGITTIQLSPHLNQFLKFCIFQLEANNLFYLQSVKLLLELIESTLRLSELELIDSSLIKRILMLSRDNLRVEEKKDEEKEEEKVVEEVVDEVAEEVEEEVEESDSDSTAILHNPETDWSRKLFNISTDSLILIYSILAVINVREKDIAASDIDEDLGDLDISEVQDNALLHIHEDSSSSRTQVDGRSNKVSEEVSSKQLPDFDDDSDITDTVSVLKVNSLTRNHIESIVSGDFESDITDVTDQSHTLHSLPATTTGEKFISGLRTGSISDDIDIADATAVNNLKNVFKIQQQGQFDEYLFDERLTSIYVMELNYFYNFRPDVLNESNTLFNWMTAGRFIENGYSKYQIPPLETGRLEEDFFILELNEILEKKAKEYEDDVLEAPELLSINFLINSSCKEDEFIERFTRQISHSDDYHIDFFEIWLCTASYIFQYQYKSTYFQFISKLHLHILIKLLKSSKSNLLNFDINEFKWKLCHQKIPVIPTSALTSGIKSSLFYMLDVLQNLLRFNLTNKLNVDNYQLSLNCIYLILKNFHRNEIELQNYSWTELYKTIFQVLNFINKQRFSNSKHIHNGGTLSTLLEEILQILNWALLSSFNTIEQTRDGLLKSINYDLVYGILLNYDVIVKIIEEYELEVLNLTECLAYFKSKIYLTEELRSEKIKKIDLLDYEFDSPEIIQLISNYLKDTTHLSNAALVSKLPLTFQYINLDLGISEADVSKISQAILKPHSSRFIHRSSK